MADGAVAFTDVRWVGVEGGAVANVAAVAAACVGLFGSGGRHGRVCIPGVVVGVGLEECSLVRSYEMMPLFSFYEVNDAG